MRQSRIFNLGFASQEGFGRGCHADDVAAPALKEAGFGARGKARTIFDQKAAAAMHNCAAAFGRIGQQAAQIVAEGIGHRYMHDQPALEKAARTRVNRIINQLIGRDELPGRVFFLQRADSIHADDEARAQLLERIDIGAVWQSVRRQGVPLAMTRQKGDALARQAADADRAAGLSERRVHVYFAHIADLGQLIQPRAANDADSDLFHFATSLPGFSELAPACRPGSAPYSLDNSPPVRAFPARLSVRRRRRLLVPDR